jgi:hypothetical protein
MADEIGIHPAVELLLKRMESHPEEFMTSEKAYNQSDSRVRKMSSLYGDILNRASEEEAALLRAAMNKIQLGLLHNDLMDELLNGDERRAKEEKENEYERHLKQSLQHMKQQQSALGQYQNAMGHLGSYQNQASATGLVGRSPTSTLMDEYVNNGTINAAKIEPTLSSSAINQIKKALGIKTKEGE